MVEGWEGRSPWGVGVGEVEGKREKVGVVVEVARLREGMMMFSTLR